jgi:ABC-type sugar transport system substrate-binding protein
MMRRRTLVLTVAAILGVAIVAGCGGSGGSGGAQGEGGEKPQQVGVILKALDNPFFVAMQEGVQDTADDMGVKADIQAASGASDTSGQTAELDSLVGRGYPCYVVNPISGTNLIQPLARISQQGTPIVNIDLPLSEEAAKSANIDVATYIGSDNVEAGRTAGEHMLQLLDDGAQVALIGGISGDVTSEQRLEGFVQAVEGDLEIVQRVAGNWNRQRAQTLATDILRANPDLGGFFAANDQMALGIATAVANAGREGEVEVIGVDGIEAALDAIERGDLTATVSQYPYAIGAMGLEACVAAAQGDKLPENAVAPVKLITEENVTKAQESFPAPFFEYENPFRKLAQK